MKYTPLRSVYFMMPLGVLHYFSCYFSEKPPPRDFRSSISDSVPALLIRTIWWVKYPEINHYWTNWKLQQPSTLSFKQISMSSVIYKSLQIQFWFAMWFSTYLMIRKVYEIFQFASNWRQLDARKLLQMPLKHIATAHWNRLSDEMIFDKRN